MADVTRDPDVVPLSRPVQRPAHRQAQRQADPLFRELAGDVLRDARRRAGLRLVNVARRAGVSPQYLSEIERGVKDPSSEMLAAVAAALDLTLDQLLRTAAGRATTVDPVCLAA